MNRFRTTIKLLVTTGIVMLGIGILPSKTEAQAGWFIFPSSTITMGAQQGGGDTSQMLIAFPPAAIASWHTTVSVPWLSLDVTSGTGPGVFNVTAKNSFPNGTYTGQIFLKDDAGVVADGVIDITFIISSSPVLSVSQTGFRFKTMAGINPPDQAFEVQSGGPGGWNTSVTLPAGLSWLSVTPTSGAAADYGTPAAATRVKVDTAGLLIGQYTGKITLTSLGSVPGTFDIPVILDITTAPILDTSPRSIELTKAANKAVEQGNTAQPSVDVINQGASETDMDWKVNQPAENWIRLSLSTSCSGPFPLTISGTTAGGRRSTITVCIDTVPVPPGLGIADGYTSTFTIVPTSAGTKLVAPGVDTIKVTMDVITHTSKPGVVSGSLVINPTTDCAPIPPQYKVVISWTSTENGNTVMKWGETLDDSGVPLYEKGLIIKPEGLDTALHTGGTLNHSITLDNSNFIYGGHKYYLEIRSTDRYGIVGDWVDHDPLRPSLYLSFDLRTCDSSVPTEVTLKVPPSTAATPLFGSILVVMTAKDESLVTTFEIFRGAAPGSGTLVRAVNVPPTSCASTGPGYGCTVTYLLSTKQFADGQVDLHISAIDALGYKQYSGVETIWVSNAVPKVTVNDPAVTDNGDGTWKAVIMWDTDIGSDSSVQYGMEDEDGNFNGYTYIVSGDDSGSTNITAGHKVTLDGLSAGRVFHYMVTSCPLRAGVTDTARCGH